MVPFGRGVLVAGGRLQPHLYTFRPFLYDFNLQINRNRNNQPKKSHISNFKPIYRGEANC